MAKLTMLLAVQKAGLNLQPPIAVTTSGTGRMSRAPSRSTTHRLRIRMKLTERSFNSLQQMLWMTRTLSPTARSMMQAMQMIWRGWLTNKIYQIEMILGTLRISNIAFIARKQS